MSGTTARPDSESTLGFHADLGGTHRLLKAVYGLFPIVAGLDKFTNLLVTWTELLPAAIGSLLPVEPLVFMYVVGVIEIVAGLVVLSRYTEYGASLVAAWLVSIAVVQVVGGNYDIAVRDVWIAVGAIALAQLDAAVIDRTTDEDVSGESQ